MKKVLLLNILVIFVVLSGCKKTEDEFNDANGNVKAKYLSRMEITSSVPKENKIINVYYDAENRVSSITDGTNSHFFNYNSSNSLTSVTDGGEPMNVSDLYQAPYDAFETGHVLEYDANKNPKTIEVYEYEGSSLSEVLTGEISYDPKPNPFFYTLQAAKVIEVLDRVDLNFSSAPPSIIKARQLFPYNNIRAMIFKNQAGITKDEVQIEYVYDSDNYPISATVNALSPDETRIYHVYYFYK